MYNRAVNPVNKHLRAYENKNKPIIFVMTFKAFTPSYPFYFLAPNEDVVCDYAKESERSNCNKKVHKSADAKFIAVIITAGPAKSGVPKGAQLQRNFLPE